MQSSSGEERALHETACRITLNGALDSLAAHRYVDAIDQVRAVDALMRAQPTMAQPTMAQPTMAQPTVAESIVAPTASAALPPLVGVEPPLAVERPTRKVASLPKRVRTKAVSEDLTDPFVAPHERATTNHSKREPASGELSDPFASRRDPATDSAPVAEQEVHQAPAPARNQEGGDLMDPFARAH
jgi:hypothetical protein